MASTTVLLKPNPHSPFFPSSVHMARFFSKKSATFLQKRAPPFTPKQLRKLLKSPALLDDIKRTASDKSSAFSEPNARKRLLQDDTTEGIQFYSPISPKRTSIIKDNDRKHKRRKRSSSETKRKVDNDAVPSSKDGADDRLTTPLEPLSPAKGWDAFVSGRSVDVNPFRLVKDGQDGTSFSRKMPNALSEVGNKGSSQHGPAAHITDASNERDGAYKRKRIKLENGNSSDTSDTQHDSGYASKESSPGSANDNKLKPESSPSTVENKRSYGLFSSDNLPTPEEEKNSPFKRSNIIGPISPAVLSLKSIAQSHALSEELAKDTTGNVSGVERITVYERSLEEEIKPAEKITTDKKKSKSRETSVDTAKAKVQWDDDIPHSFRIGTIPAKFDVNAAWSEIPKSVLSGIKKTVGIGNIGNYCYMNSALQLLAHCPPLVYYLVYYHTKSKCILTSRNKFHIKDCKRCRKLKDRDASCPDCILCMLRKLVVASHEKPGAAMNRNFNQDLGSIIGQDYAKRGHRHRQNDSGEAFSFILSRAIEQLKKAMGFDDKSSKETPIEKIFNWEIASVVKCRSCPYESKTINKHLMHVVQVPMVSGKRNAAVPIAPLIKHTDIDYEIVKPWTCESCKRMGCEKYEEIKRLPKYAVINLSRRQKYGRARENRVPVTVKPTIELRTAEGDRQTFALTSVCAHSGSMGGGHWIHEGRLPTGWLHHSDSHVSPVQFSEKGLGGGAMISLLGFTSSNLSDNLPSKS